jgi:hypothetical protein
VGGLFRERKLRGEDGHGSVGEHVWDNVQTNHLASDVDLVELGYSPVAVGDCDVLERDVERVFGCLHIPIHLFSQLLQRRERLEDKTHRQRAFPGMSDRS